MKLQGIKLTRAYGCASVCCFVYCFIVHKAEIRHDFHCIWVVAGAVLALLAIFNYLELKERMPEWFLRICSGVSTTALILFLGIEGCIVCGFFFRPAAGLQYLLIPETERQTDGLDLDLRFRLDKAYRYLKENPETICIVSGGSRNPEGITQAQLMQEYLLSKGVEPGRLKMEQEAQTPAECIGNGAKLMDSPENTFAVVTNNYYSYHAVHLARKAGFEDVRGMVAWADPVFFIHNTVREFFTISIDLFTGQL